MDCLFCKIIAGDIPSTVVYEDDTVFCMKDINPQAPIHLLVLPKAHIASAAEIGPENASIVAHIFETIATRIAVGPEFADGFRVVTNCGENGCQSVKHLHFHVLAGEKLSDRMA